MRIIRQARWMIHADLRKLKIAHKIKKEHDYRRIHGSASTEYYHVSTGDIGSEISLFTGEKITLSGRERYTLKEIYDKLTLSKSGD